MAGSGVNASNAAELIATTGVRGVHASCSSARAPFTEEAPVVAKARALGFMDAGARGGRFTDGVKVEELATVLRELSHT